MNSCENHVLACISEVNGPVGMNFGVVMYNHGRMILDYYELQQMSRSQVVNSCENHVLACISEMNGPAGMNFGIAVYNHEWIIFYSLGIDLKGQGHRSQVISSDENNVLACISEVNGPAGVNFGVVVYNHEWIIFCSLGVDLKGQGHRSRVNR